VVKISKYLVLLVAALLFTSTANALAVKEGDSLRFDFVLPSGATSASSFAVGTVPSDLNIGEIFRLTIFDAANQQLATLDTTINFTSNGQGFCPCGVSISTATFYAIFTAIKGSADVTTAIFRTPLSDNLYSGRISAVNPVPVPAALPLLMTGLGALGFAGWRRKRREAASI